MTPEEMEQFHRDMGASTFDRSWDILFKTDRKQFDADMNDEYWFGMK